MDFAALTKKLAGFADKAVDASSDAFAKAGKITGDLLEKTADFSYDKLKTSPFTLVDGAALDETIALKSSVIFVIGGPEDVGSKSIIGRMPLLIGKAWQYSTTLRILYAENFAAQISALSATIPCALIYRNGVQKHMLVDTELVEFLESFDITKDWTAAAGSRALTPVSPVWDATPASSDSAAS